MSNPAVLFVGRRASDRAFFRQVVDQIGATPVETVRRAVEHLRVGALAAMVIGDDVDDGSALRLIALARRAQPTIVVMFLWSEERATGAAVRVPGAKVVERRLLGAALRGVLCHDAQEAEAHDADAEILLVDDDALVLRMMNRSLRALGYKTAMAPSPAVALALLEQRPFKMLIFDVDMPEQSGIELARSLRAGELGGTNQDAPLVFVTADDRAKTFTDTFDAGAMRCLIKPFDGEHLGAVVAGLLHEAA